MKILITSKGINYKACGFCSSYDGAIAKQLSFVILWIQ